MSRPSWFTEDVAFIALIMAPVVLLILCAGTAAIIESLGGVL